MFRMEFESSGSPFKPSESEDQSSQDWHTWRDKGLGSSDAPVLMGVSPWRNILDLYREKALGEKKEQTNFATERGKALEGVARDIYEFEYGTTMGAKNFVHKRFSYIKASLDGFNENLKAGIEIKCPGKADLEKARHGEIPEKYYPQLQWQMLASDAKWIDYCSFDGKSELIVIKCLPDKAYQRELVSLARWFWFHVRNKIEIVPRGLSWGLEKGS